MIATQAKFRCGIVAWVTAYGDDEICTGCRRQFANAEIMSGVMQTDKNGTQGTGWFCEQCIKDWPAWTRKVT